MYSDISTSNTDFAKFEKSKDNFSWFYSNYDMIEKDIHNQYVAVKDRKHIDNNVHLETHKKTQFEKLRRFNCYRVYKS